MTSETPVGLRSGAVRRLRSLAGSRSARREERAFVIEGVKTIRAALASGARIDALFVEGSADGPGPDGAGDLVRECADAGAEVVAVQAGVLARSLETVTPQPVAAIAGFVDVPAEALRREELTLVVFLAGISDPGNAGTLVRSAAAAGADAVVFGSGSVDLYNPKTVRSTAGSLFHIRSCCLAGDDGALLGELGRKGLARWATEARGGLPYTEAALDRPAVVVLGNEAHGIPPALAAEVDGVLTIPMANDTESLNVAVTGSIVCFEAARQRRLASARGAA